MDHVVSTNIRNNILSGIHDNELKFDYNSSLTSELVSNPQPVVSVNLRTDKNSVRLMHPD